MATGWPAYKGVIGLQCLSTCDLKVSVQISICSWTWRAAGSVLWILAGMVVLSWHWYRSSAGDGSMASIWVAQSPRRVNCGSAPLYLAHWNTCFTDFTHASANPFDCVIVWAWGLMGDTQRTAEISKLGTQVLRTIVRLKDFQDSMLWEHFLEQWDDFDGVALARWKTLDKDHLRVEVTTYEVVNSFQDKDVHGAHLPWVGWSWCRCEGCCSILGLEPGAGLTLMALFIPGQKIHPCASNWALVIPWWNWCSWCSILSLSKGGTMRVSPQRTRTSSMVGVSWCCQ